LHDSKQLENLAVVLASNGANLVCKIVKRSIELFVKISTKTFNAACCSFRRTTCPTFVALRRFVKMNLIAMVGLAFTPSKLCAAPSPVMPPTRNVRSDAFHTPIGGTAAFAFDAQRWRFPSA
jgi:hypothetical protein